MNRPCICDEATCFLCCRFYNNITYNKLWGGDGLYIGKLDCSELTIKGSSTKKVGRELGDLVEKALAKVGITNEKISKWLGKECGCKERKEKLNRLGRWAKRVLGLKK